MKEEESGGATLEKQGWTRRFVAGEPRLSEAVEAYNQAGFEVCLRPLPTKERECRTCPGEEKSHRNGRECRVCFEGLEDQYRIIYTRPARRGSEEAS
jgi:hypothetical protein